MGKSPGHQKWPDHKVGERHVEGRVRVVSAGQVIAESTDVIEVDEDGYPARYYIPRTDVKMGLLERTNTTTQCPFKGTAHYYSVKAAGQTVPDAVWTYEDPFDEHQALKDRLAFYGDKVRIEAPEQRAP